MFGGTETIASVIEWAMAEMIRSPADLSRVQQELVDVVGVDRRVQDSDFEKLTFLRRAIKETLRLQPPVPLLQHETADDADIGGYAIPKQAQVVVNAWAINRDPEAWDEPETFKPSRFLKEGAPDFKGSNFEFIPFCSGWRSCPGMQLALYTLELAVAHLLHCFTWDLPDGMKLSELDMNDVFGLTLPRAERLVAIPTPSLQFPLF
ncbi:PREDICTED: cytochrome P450 84A1-like [Nelumbo nucifera]|nr:PREDICTED: cytochrome P450 84A1-like [Nelumbo nucifera]